MAKNSSRRSATTSTATVQPQPQPQTGETAAAPVLGNLPDNVIAHPRSEFLEKKLKEQGKAKASHQPEARQLLAQVADLESKGRENDKEMREIEDRAAVLLYIDRANGAMTSEAVTETIGDVYGWRNKADPQTKWEAGKHKEVDRSKTPFGRGEAFRKRIVRAVQAREYVTGEAETAFFRGMPKEAIRDTLQAMEKGDLGFWAAYERFAEIKRAHRTPPLNPVLDPKKVAEFAKSLQADGIAAAIAKNPALDAAYTALYGVLVETYREIEDMSKAA